jgi:hypothetical protein
MQTSYRGQFIWGHEVRTFRPCGEQQTYWVKTSKDLMEQLRKQYMEVSSRPYQSTHIEFKGQIVDEERSGFALDYDGLIYVNKLIKAPQSMPSECE